MKERMALRKKKKPSQRAAKQQLGDQLILVSRLHLNLSNPRHEPVESEAIAIAKLCDTELIAELAQDIAQRGSLSPLEVMGVVPMTGHPGHFISLEGNRRTCALIVANDPSRAPEPIRQQLRRITADANLPKQVKAHVFADEAQAKQWIDLRHLGLQGGAGAKEWDTTQKFRAAGGNTKTSARDNTLAVLVLDRLVSRGMLSAEQRREANVTTLTRYLGTPGVRAILGLGSNKELIYTHDAEEVDNALLRVVLDSLTPLDDGSYRVNSRSNSTQRVQYANELKSQGYAPSSHLDTPEEPPAPTKARTQAETATTATTKRRSANHPDTRKRLIPTDFPVSVNDPILLRLRREGTTLEINEFTFSANYILRALVEQIMTLFAKKQGRFNPNMTDNALTQACADELRKLGVTGKALTNVEKAAGAQHTGHSLHSLGHAVHGGTIPTSTDLKKHFDTWRPALEAMLNTISAKK
ncbi:hypothetical protein QE400_003254 [Xanthomonas sacchari]|uniref:hypothetical protein n=1 Tax=Xanthomonas sacchari TaxID=56458 RepID=UPI002782A1BC|nr:hypothetical protein [Xanthomonas sacchari]MDQ1093841.1 hypothetical protein [Xanthomonas sacchari]